MEQLIKSIGKRPPLGRPKTIPPTVLGEPAGLFGRASFYEATWSKRAPGPLKQVILAIFPYFYLFLIGFPIPLRGFSILFISCYTMFNKKA